MKLQVNDDNQKIFDISLVLSKVLELVFPESKGIIVDTPTDTKTFTNSEKLLVHKKDGTIQITTINTELEEGSYIEVQI